MARGRYLQINKYIHHKYSLLDPQGMIFEAVNRTLIGGPFLIHKSLRTNLFTWPKTTLNPHRKIWMLEGKSQRLNWKWSKSNFSWETKFSKITPDWIEWSRAKICLWFTFIWSKIYFHSRFKYLASGSKQIFVTIIPYLQISGTFLRSFYWKTHPSKNPEYLFSF